MKLPLRAAALPILLLVVFVFVPGIAAQPISAPEDSILARRVVELVNQERVKAGLLPLKWNDTLAAAAAAYAQEMAERNFFAHNSPEGTTPVERARRAGYDAYGWGGLYVGENLAKGYSTPEGAMQGWMASESHRNNILLAKYRETGVGVATAPNGVKIWAEEFGSRPKVLPIFINNDAPTTESPNVTLSICAETVSSWGSLGDIVQMMVSNDANFAGAVWEPYSQLKQWRLKNEPGLQRVFVRMRDKNGVVVESSDEIQLVGRQALGIAQSGDAQPIAGAPNTAQASPTFKLGFKLLADLIPDRVGAPLENEHSQANGDSIQRTTTGLMVWRKADNLTAFTNGSWTWIFGPDGLKDRANDQRFYWEGQ